jgi:peptidoglycan/LPS O-acetylase OafA/YrhL
LSNNSNNRDLQLIYLYAWPVQQLLIQAAGPTFNPWTLSLAALFGSGLLAWLSWTLVERPALAFKRPRRT